MHSLERSHNQKIKICQEKMKIFRETLKDTFNKIFCIGSMGKTQGTEGIKQSLEGPKCLNK